MTTIVLNNSDLRLSAGNRVGLMAAALSAVFGFLERAGQRRAVRELLVRADLVQDGQPSYAADLRAAAAYASMK